MLRQAGSRQQTIKQKNRALVLQAVLNRGIVSRAEIARSLGLTKTTLTNIVSELIEDGILEESEPFSSENGGMGRKSIGLTLSGEAPLICGVLIQRGNLHVVLADLKGEIQIDSRYRYRGLISPEEFRHRLETLYLQTCSQARQRILAVGISCIGNLNTVEGIMRNPHHFFTEACDFPITSFLEGLSNLPVWLCNDASAGAIAEKLFGKGRDVEDFLYISTFNGIGAGFYLGNRLYNGEFGQNGEIGHMSINHWGPQCVCGNNGCLEVYADISRILQGYRHFQEYLPDHPLLAMQNPTISDLLPLIDSGDILAMCILTEYCRYLAAAVSNLLTQLDISLVILAGSPKTTGNFFENTLAHMLNETAAPGKYRDTIVVKSDFGLDSPLYGSVGIVLDKIFTAELDPSTRTDFSD
ncbi:MAG: ROK family protein [Candidatus Merdivicinus sp.]|jgi:predicted NBD/HSP70 family sugar kinase